MNRRDMLSLLAMGATPFVFNKSFGNTLTSPLLNERELPKKFGDGRDWFFEKRFGMFVHWGIYSVPAWHEQHQWRARVPRAKYMKFADEFNPKKFNPEQWLDLMQEVGMKYITFTSKHCDGFCMWDTRQTKFNIMNTPYKKDILGMLSEACYKRKIPLCLYYSVIDWNHPNYPNQGRDHELKKDSEPGDKADWPAYFEFVKAQMRELCTNYGDIHGIWWDVNRPKYYDPSMNNMIRELQPNAVINNRGFDEGDFGTPERDSNEESIIFYRPTEACESVDSLSWGYKKDAEYFSDKYLINSIDRYLSGNANYLLNVGPTAEGLIPEEPAAILKRIGKWYGSVKESYEKVQPGISLSEPFTNIIKTENVSITRRDHVLYIHFNKNTIAKGLPLKDINVLPKSATLLNDGRPVDYVLTMSPTDHSEQKKFLRLQNLPVNEMSNTTIVVKLVFDKNLNSII